MMLILAITVYFVGLMTYDSGSQQFIVPDARATRSYGATPLMPHHASIIIKGLKGGEADCTTLHGTWAAPRCTVDLAGTTLELPASTTAFTTAPAFDKVPKLGTLCSAHALNATYKTDKSKYAGLVTITNGSLDACSEGNAWFSRLTFSPATAGEPALTFKKGHVTILVTVKDDAVLQITNDPDSPADEKTQQDHFFWYYTMLSGTEDCSALPPEPAPAEKHNCGYTPIHTYTSAASGVGCSNTNYP